MYSAIMVSKKLSIAAQIEMRIINATLLPLTSFATSVIMPTVAPIPIAAASRVFIPSLMTLHFLSVLIIPLIVAFVKCFNQILLEAGIARPRPVVK